MTSTRSIFPGSYKVFNPTYFIWINNCDMAISVYYSTSRPSANGINQSHGVGERYHSKIETRDPLREAARQGLLYIWSLMRRISSKQPQSALQEAVRKTAIGRLGSRLGISHIAYRKDNGGRLTNDNLSLCACLCRLTWRWWLSRSPSEGAFASNLGCLYGSFAAP